MAKLAFAPDYSFIVRETKRTLKLYRKLYRRKDDTILLTMILKHHRKQIVELKNICKHYFIEA